MHLTINKLLPGLQKIPTERNQYCRKIPQKVSRRAYAVEYPYLVTTQVKSSPSPEASVTFCPVAESGAEPNPKDIKPGLIFAQLQLADQTVSLLREKNLYYDGRGLARSRSTMELKIIPARRPTEAPAIKASFQEFNGKINVIETRAKRLCFNSAGNLDRGTKATDLPSTIHKVIDEINKWLNYCTS